MWLRRHLEGWKEIAGYFGRTVRTVQRWERDEKLPIRRHLHSDLSSVYADPLELDEWRARHAPRLDAVDAPSLGNAPGDERILVEMAWEHWKHRTKEGFQRCLALAHTALTINPEHGPAHTILALAHVIRATYALRPPMEDLGLARTYARRALELDPTSVGAQQAIGFLAYFERDWVAAHRAFTAALARDPDNPMTLQFFSVWYLVQNRNDEACAMSLRAEALAPDWMITSAHAVWMLHYSGRLDDAIHKARALIRRDRLFWRGYFNLALSLIARGRYQEAVKAAEVGAALSDVPALQAVLVDAAARAGDRGRAQRTLADIRSRRTYFSPYWHALACTGLGDHRSALTQLRRSVDRCEWFLAFLKHDPGFAALHGAPAFAVVCQQAGLP